METSDDPILLPLYQLFYSPNQKLVRGGIKRYKFTDNSGTDKFKETSLVYMFNSRGDINMYRHGKPNIPVPDQDRLFAIILWYVAKTLY